MLGEETMGWGQNAKDKVKDRTWRKAQEQAGLWRKWSQIQFVGRSG